MDKEITPISRLLLRSKKKNKNMVGDNYIERLNYVRLSYYLINCGYFTQWLSIDDNGADFTAIKYDSSTIYKIQLKSRVTLNSKYEDKDLCIAFPLNSKKPEKDWVIVKYTDLKEIFGNQKSYVEKGSWSTPSVPKKYRQQVIAASLIAPVSFSWFDE